MRLDERPDHIYVNKVLGYNVPLSRKLLPSQLSVKYVSVRPEF